MKKTLSLVFLFAVMYNGYSQTASKNEEHCQAVEARKSINRVTSIFEITFLESFEKEALSNFLYLNNNSIFLVKFDSSDGIILSHISDITTEDLKSLLVEFNCYKEFISRTIIQKQDLINE